MVRERSEGGRKGNGEREMKKEEAGGSKME